MLSVQVKLLDNSAKDYTEKTFLMIVYVKTDTTKTLTLTIVFPVLMCAKPVIVLIIAYPVMVQWISNIVNQIVRVLMDTIWKILLLIALNAQKDSVHALISFPVNVNI